MTHKKKIIWEYAKAIITALMLALLIRAFIIQAFKIPSGSMIPTLLVGDHILVNKFLYGTKIPFKDKRAFMFKKPERGDIIVFKYPENPEYCKGLSSTVMKRIKNAVERREVWQLLTDDCKDFIKRVVAIEGDVIESKNKMIHVNGNKVNEPYAQHTDSSMRPMGIEPRDNFGPVIVPKNKYFVMGDNRDQSYDSRYWGYVDIKDVKGKALILYWSWDTEKSWARFGRIGSLIH